MLPPRAVRQSRKGLWMTRLKIGHVGLHVRNLEEEIEFLQLLGAEVTSVDRLGRGRVAFVSLDGVWHHNFALFEDGAPLPSGDSQKERLGLDHVAMMTDKRASVDAWKEKLTARGIRVTGPQIQGPDGGGLEGGSGSYTIFFTDPNGICFEIFAEPMTVSEFRGKQAMRASSSA
jgi:catechol 2,3-dioxygenase-like lactoylglutathione lyase family enzyme